MQSNQRSTLGTLLIILSTCYLYHDPSLALFRDLFRGLFRDLFRDLVYGPACDCYRQVLPYYQSENSIAEQAKGLTVSWCVLLLVPDLVGERVAA